MDAWDGIQGGVYYAVQSMEAFWEFYKELEKQTVIAVDTETTGLSWVRHQVCGIVVGWGVANNYYLPIRMKGVDIVAGAPQLNIEDIRESLAKVFMDKNVTKLFWNERFDRHMLRNDALDIEGIIHDGSILSHLDDENTNNRLKDNAKRRIDPKSDKWEIEVDKWRNDEAKRRRKTYSEFIIDQLGTHRVELEEELFADPQSRFEDLKKSQITARLKKILRDRHADHPLAANKKDDVSYDYIPLDIMVPYACADVHYTFLLYKSLLIDVGKRDGLRKLYINEIRLSDVLYDTEQHGLKADLPYLQKLEPEIRQQVLDLQAEIYSDIGFEFSMDSNIQLIEALLKAGCKLTKLTKKGTELARNGDSVETKHFSVDNDTLESLASTHPFAAKIQNYRKKQKLLSTYVVKIQDLADSNSYIHPSFNANVSTGRMSCRDPNLQNIPGRDLSIRKAFIVDDIERDFYLFMDYSQVELRLTAHHSQDPILLDAYPFDGPSQDVHSITCAEAVMGITLEEYMKVFLNEDHPQHKEYKWFRNIAKRVNFGIIYGAGPGAIQRQVSTPDRPVTRDECQKYIDAYLTKYDGVRDWIRRTEYFLRQNGHLVNTFGRLRTLADADSKEKWKRERCARQGVNFMIQGDAADLFKTAVVRVHSLLKKRKAQSKIVNFVHDEIQFYWNKNEMDLLPEVKKVMEDFPQYSVPIVVDAEMSDRDWGSKKELVIAS